MHKDQLTTHARELLNTLRERDDWMSRAELASALSREKLSPHSIGLLRQMASQHIIEVRRVTITSKTFSYEYRVKQQ